MTAIAMTETVTVAIIFFVMVSHLPQFEYPFRSTLPSLVLRVVTPDGSSLFGGGRDPARSHDAAAAGRALLEHELAVAEIDAHGVALAEVAFEQAQRERQLFGG